jgi:hypothetical protein
MSYVCEGLANRVHVGTAFMNRESHTRMNPQSSCRLKQMAKVVASDYIFSLMIRTAEGVLQRDLTIVILNAYSRIQRIPPRSLIARE